ncbi:MAG: hypothetical protein Alpg2KO_25660 [Alphaproteobacteria bacterium]
MFDSLPILILIGVILWLIFEQYRLSKQLKDTRDRLDRAETWIRATAAWLADNWKQAHTDVSEKASDSQHAAEEPQVSSANTDANFDASADAGLDSLTSSIASSVPNTAAPDLSEDIHDIPPATPQEQKPSPWGQAAPVQPQVWHKPDEQPKTAYTERADQADRPAAPPLGSPWEEASAPKGPSLLDRLKGMTARDWMLGFGGLALALAGVFVVQYSIQNQVLGPIGRCLLALSFGFALIGVALLPKFRIKQPPLAEVMAGAGVLTLYGASFAGHALYGLIGPVSAFLAIIAVTVMGLGLSLLMGRRIAWLAMAGGYLVPLIVNSPEPSIWPVMVYVSALTAGLLWLARDRGWVELLPLSAAGLFAWQGIILLVPLAEGETALMRMLPIALSSLLMMPIWTTLHHLRKAWPERLKGAHTGALFIGFFGLMIALMAVQKLDFTAPALIWLTLSSGVWLYGLRFFPKALNPGAFGTASIWIVTIMAWALGGSRAVLPFDYAVTLLVLGLPILLRLTSRGQAFARAWRMLSMLYVPIAVLIATLTKGWLISAGLTQTEQYIAVVVLLALTLLHLPVPELRDDDLADDKILRNFYRVTSTFWPLMPAGWLMLLFLSGDARWPLHVAAFALPAMMAVLTRKRADKTLHALIAAGAVLLPAAFAPLVWNGQTALADLSLWGLLMTPALMALAARRGWVPPVLDALAPFAVILGYIFARITGWPQGFDAAFAVLLEGMVLVTSTFVLMRGMALKSEEARSILIGFAGLSALLSMLPGEYPAVTLLGLIAIMLGLFAWYARAGRLPVGPLSLGIAGFMLVWMFIDMGILSTLPTALATQSAAVPFHAAPVLVALWSGFSLYRLGWEKADEHWAVSATIPPLVVLWGAWGADILFEGVTPWVLSGFVLMVAFTYVLLRRVPRGARDVFEDQAISVLAAAAVISFIFCGYALGTGKMLAITFAAASAIALIGYGALRIRRLDFWAAGLAGGAFVIGMAQLGPTFRGLGVEGLWPASSVQHAALPLVLLALGLGFCWRMGRGDHAIPLWLTRLSLPLGGLIIIAGGIELNGPLLTSWTRVEGWTGWGIGMVGVLLSLGTYLAHLLLSRRESSPLRGAVLSLGILAAVWVLGVGLALRNPAFTNMSVGTLPILNATALLALLPALIGALLARSLIANRGETAWTARITAMGATLIGAVWVAMAVRQGFQGDSLFRPRPSTAESLTTCLGLTAYAALLLALGFRSNVRLWRQLGLSTLLATFGLVSWMAWTRLEGLASAGAFLGLAAVLLGGYALYDRLEKHLGTGDEEQPQRTA